MAMWSWLAAAMWLWTAAGRLCRVATGKTHLIYRRTEADAPADHEEIVAAKAEGVEFHFLCGQDSLVVENGKITGLRVMDMERTDRTPADVRGVRPIEGSEHVIPAAS